MSRGQEAGNEERAPKACGENRPEASLLEVRGLVKNYGHRSRLGPVLRGVDLTLRKGEVVALVGPSGAGKTTLLLVLAGLLAADSGRAVLGGSPLPLGETSRGRHRMSLVFQDPYAALSPHRSVYATVAEPLRIRRRGAVDDAVVRRALSAAQLAPPEAFLHRYPAQLSGGQRQRVAIARAIVTEPELLLADEPTSMLDASAGVGILNLFRELAQGGMALLVTLHDLAFACYAADRILILSQGVVVEEGPPAELLADARHDLTRRLVAAARVRDLSRGAGEPVEA
ncbi:MAG: dipeptide/oligopeptide/nickel ABC transporter ATP-binding protein [Syntrophobacteraceae bacterium]|nr:dipeptide/oligopeptide/nickel ABC transporter ATP-binding protein [Syntrophobacteraceae bacterium]